MGLEKVAIIDRIAAVVAEYKAATAVKGI